MNLIELIEKRRIRIALTPEYEGGWHADIYGDEDTYCHSGYGGSVEEAIRDALSNEDD